MATSRWPRPCPCPCLLPLMLLLALLLLVPPLEADTPRPAAPFRPRPSPTSPPSPVACPVPRVDVAAWLAVYNRELLRVRQQQAQQAWEALTGRPPHAPSRPRHTLSAADTARWQEQRAWEARCFFRSNATEPQRRMLHLIARGPRYSLSQARQAKSLSRIGTCSLARLSYSAAYIPRLPTPKLQRSLGSLVGALRRRYSNTTVTLGHVTLRGEADLTRLMTSSRDPELLTAAWRGWHDALSAAAAPLFTRAVAVMNSAARRGGYRDMGAAWRAELELGGGEGVQAVVERLYRQVAPLYRLLHAVVRGALRKHYGRELVRRDHPIPVHLSGDLWGQDWTFLLDLLLPLPPSFGPAPPRPAAPAPSPPRPDDNNLLAVDIVKKAQRVFEGLGFPPLPPSVLTHAWLGGGGGREGGCHPSALDMFTPGDYRLVVCGGRSGGVGGGSDRGGTAVQEALHELGHVHYFHAYRHLPPVFRDAPNSALHEAIGDTVQLAALAHDPLRSLLREALSKLPRFAFAAALETWRWDVFQGTVGPSEYNPSFWRLRAHYQGVSPPSPRPPHALDAAAKYHVAHNIPYVRYLVAVVAQFQVHQGLCEAALGRPLPLPSHACPPAALRTAAPTLRRVMSAGASVTWREALGALTGGSRDLDAAPLLEYLAPLTRWLQRRVRAENLTLGW
ncbi:angiotensin-converting enzyme-like [Eriocheir sinensis]|uniref:angiotensin-converting enzyme-like n=1 Tax=Eriocheir sinensis TaxID=95602 RepID=UPI0021C72EA6|nr:angiotensin-converting enzyme-like [Eriocheir sinensis]